MTDRKEHAGHRAGPPGSGGTRHAPKPHPENRQQAEKAKDADDLRTGHATEGDGGDNTLKH